MRQHKRRGAVTRPTANHVYSAYSKLLECLDTPVALSCYILLKEGEFEQLVRKDVSAKDYDDPRRFRDDYLAVSVLSKSDFLRTDINRREAAVTRFWQGEHQCAESNHRLSEYAAGRLMPKDARIHGVLHRAREHIRRILGDSPQAAVRDRMMRLMRRSEALGLPLSHETAYRRVFKARFGPGVTSSVKGDVVIAKKYKSRLDVTPRLYPYFRDLLGIHQQGLDVKLLASNKVTFVPKNAKTDRTIAVEPTVNVYAQLGVGGLIRDALRSDGLDLRTQYEFNRFLAGIAHEARLATIDLSMASDTLCRELVWLLLPEGWADLLDVVRSPYGDLNGVEFEYEKFSSMGNGSTFELETLIFWALTLASGSRRSLSSVFGDDIIVEQHCSDLLIEVLEFCGFAVNQGKSFLAGQFFESCGADYFQGHPVRPFFWKSLEPTLFYKMANDVSRHATLVPGRYLDARLLPCWLRCVTGVPRGMKVTVPRGVGDIGIVHNLDAPLTQQHLRWRRDLNVWRFPALTFEPRIVPVWDDYGGLAASLDGLMTLERNPGMHTVRDRGVYSISDHYIMQWSDLGTWI